MNILRSVRRRERSERKSFHIESFQLPSSNQPSLSIAFRRCVGSPEAGLLFVFPPIFEALCTLTQSSFPRSSQTRRPRRLSSRRPPRVLLRLGSLDAFSLLALSLYPDQVLVFFLLSFHNSNGFPRFSSSRRPRVRARLLSSLQDYGIGRKKL